MNNRITVLITFIAIFLTQCTTPEEVLYPSYEGLVLCGYQGWFRAEGDDAGRGWGHFGNRGKFDPENITIDLWPDMSEYEKTYPTHFINADSSVAHIFSSVDSTTTNLHFKWMKDYDIDGVFMQRFFGVGRTERTRVGHPPGGLSPGAYRRPACGQPGRCWTVRRASTVASLRRHRIGSSPR